MRELADQFVRRPSEDETPGERSSNRISHVAPSVANTHHSARHIPVEPLYAFAVDAVVVCEATAYLDEFPRRWRGGGRGA